MFCLLTHLKFLILFLAIVNILLLLLLIHIVVNLCDYMSFLIYSLNFLCINLDPKNMHAQLFCKEKKNIWSIK